MGNEKWVSFVGVGVRNSSKTQNWHKSIACMAWNTERTFQESPNNWLWCYLFIAMSYGFMHFVAMLQLHSSRVHNEIRSYSNELFLCFAFISVLTNFISAVASNFGCSTDQTPVCNRIRMKIVFKRANWKGAKTQF